MLRLQESFIYGTTARTGVLDMRLFKGWLLTDSDVIKSIEGVVEIDISEGAGWFYPLDQEQISVCAAATHYQNGHEQPIPIREVSRDTDVRCREYERINFTFTGSDDH